jgi:hypothetical protein
VSSVDFGPTSEEPGVAKIIYAQQHNTNKYWCMPNPFYKTRLVYQILTHINVQREELLGELVAYSQDPVRMKRRLRMLTNLSQYEQMFLEKIQNFETDDNNDLNQELLGKIKTEVDYVVDRDA